MRLLLFAITVLLFACTPSGSPGIPKPAANTKTYIPIYMSSTLARRVEYVTPKPIVNSGKIFTIGNYLLQVELDSGIHVINYADRSAPIKIGFIKSINCSEMAIKGNFLYINNLNDLVILNISDINKPTEVSRISNAFPFIGKDLPPVQGTFFECPDPSKGEVISWKEELRDYPKCYR